MRPSLLIPVLAVLAARPAGAQAPPAEPADAPVVVSLTANGSPRADVWPGQPLLVAADLLHRDAYGEDVTAVTIAAEGGSWAGALALTVLDGGGRAQTWPLHAAPVAAGPLTLDAESAGRAVFSLSPDETGALAPGTYALHAALDSTALGAPGAYRSPRSVPVVLTVHPAGDAPGPEAAADARLLLADYHVLRGQEAEALAVVDAFLAEEADHPVALAYRGELLRVAGRGRDAVDALSAAVQASGERHPDAAEPPAALLFLLDEATTAWEFATSFEVAVVDKGPSHPYTGQGGDLGFAIDGTPGEELYLERGTTYTFRLSDVPDVHPFALTADPEGGDPYTAGVVGTPATGDALVTFTPGEATPDVLYYGSTAAPWMGSRLRIVSAHSRP
jgi:hypothetical protein